MWANNNFTSRAQLGRNTEIRIFWPLDTDRPAQRSASASRHAHRDLH